MKVTSAFTYLKVSACKMVACLQSVIAQNITGNLRDAKTSQPVSGALVSVKGTTLGVFTDVGGEFSLPAP